MKRLAAVPGRLAAAARGSTPVGWPAGTPAAQASGGSPAGSSEADAPGGGGRSGRGPGSLAWSVDDIVLHLLVVEEGVWFLRLRQLAAAEDPRWSWTEPVLEGRRRGRSLDELLRAFAARRAETLDHVAGLGDDGWQRTGTHDVFGILDVAALLREMLAHDEEHLAALATRSA